MSKLFPLPVNRRWCWLLRRVWPDPKTGPFSVPFLSVTLICISPHIGKLLRASKGGFWQLDVLEYNAMSRRYWWKSSVIFLFGAGTARCQVSRLFVFPLNPYGRLWLHVHDTEHTAVFSITDPTARHLFATPRGRAFYAEPLGEMRIVSWRCDSELFLPPFSLRIVHWDR